MTKYRVTVLVLLVLLFIGQTGRIERDQTIESLRSDIKWLVGVIEDKEEVIAVYYNRIAEHETEIRELKEKLNQKEEILNGNVFEAEITYYAPLDPSAVEGWCYSGDPTVTASGAKSEPGVSVAAGSQIPFGTELYIEGIGFRTVHDRGGMIGSNNIDVMVWSRSEALENGREKRKVWILDGVS